MKIPKGISQEDLMATLEKVIDRIAPKYTFHGYTAEDIKQEAFIICIEKILPEWDRVRPLENFLSFCLSNRLKNFVRDTHYLNVENEQKVRVVKPAQLDNENMVLDERDDGETALDYKDMQSIINKHLPSSYRLDYLKMVNEVYTSKARREEIKSLIMDILKDHGYDASHNDET